MNSIERKDATAPLFVLHDKAVVAGYFDSGKYVQVTFREYLALAMEAAQSGGKFPKYLKEIDSFRGARFLTSVIPGMPEIAVPVFEVNGGAP